MKMTVFWDVAPCSLVEIYRRFRGAYCLHHQGDHSVQNILSYLKIKTYATMGVKLGFTPKERTKTEDAWEQRTEENIWTLVGGSGRGLEIIMQ
jgi:hypothetical protein